MTEERLKEIEARANAATVGPWEEVGENGEFWMYSGFEGPNECVVLADTGRNQFRCQEDVDFIAHSRQDIPDLCAALRAARERIKELEGK